jgi:uncharacterized membrane protein
MRTRAGLERLVTFLDAVVAIAITLLILPLVDVLAAEQHKSLSAVYSDNAGRLGAFVLSFVVIARLWLGHHRTLEQVGAYDSDFVVLNIAWLLTIVFLPFATQVGAVYGGQQRLAFATYVGAIAASSLCLSLIAVLVQRRSTLWLDGVKPGQVQAIGSLVTTALMLLALIVGVAIPRVNYWALLLLLLSAPVERFVRSRRKDSTAESAG